MLWLRTLTTGLPTNPAPVYTERGARTARWARKHPGRVGVIGTGLLVAALALAAGLGIVSHFNNQLDKANTDLGQANTRLDRANSDLTKTNSVFQTVSGILASVAKDIDPAGGQTRRRVAQGPIGQAT